MENADKINLIDVEKTLLSLIDDPYGIRSVVMAVDEEEQDLPVRYPPEDSFERLVWLVQGQMEELDIFLREKHPEELLPFIKLSVAKQQRILYRAYFIQQKFFFCKGRFWEPVYKTVAINPGEAEK